MCNTTTHKFSVNQEKGLLTQLRSREKFDLNYFSLFIYIDN